MTAAVTRPFTQAMPAVSRLINDAPSGISIWLVLLLLLLLWLRLPVERRYMSDCQPDYLRRRRRSVTGLLERQQPAVSILCHA